MPRGKPFTLRFDAVNLLDELYKLRHGTGISVFVPANWATAHLPRGDLTQVMNLLRAAGYLKVSLEQLETDQPR